MRNTVIKKIEFDGFNRQGQPKKGYLMVKIDHQNHTVDFDYSKSIWIDTDTFISVCLKDKDIQKELEWAVQKYIRMYPISIRTFEGMSGCQDIQLCYYKAKEWAAIYRNAELALEIHITMWNKLELPAKEIFSGDLAEIINYLLGSWNGSGGILSSMFFAAKGLQTWKKTIKEIKRLPKFKYCYFDKNRIIPTTTSICGYNY